MVSLLTRTALLALRLSHSTAWMACDVELLDGIRPATCVGLVLLLVGDLHTLPGLVGFLKEPSAFRCSSLSPSSSQHSSALCTFTLPWSLEFMFARYQQQRVGVK